MGNSNQIYIRANDDRIIDAIIEFIRPMIGNQIREVDLNPKLAKDKPDCFFGGVSVKESKS